MNLVDLPLRDALRLYVRKRKLDQQICHTMFCNADYTE